MDIYFLVCCGQAEPRVISTSGRVEKTSLHSHARSSLIGPLVLSPRGRKPAAASHYLTSGCTHQSGTGSRLREREKMCVRYEVVLGGRSSAGCQLAENKPDVSLEGGRGEAAAAAAGSAGRLWYSGAAVTVCSPQPVCSEPLLLLPVPELRRVCEVRRRRLPVRLHSDRLLRRELHRS